MPIEALWILLLPAGMIGLTALGAVATAAERRRARNKAWLQAVEKARLAVVGKEEGGLFGGGWLHARGERLYVRLQRASHSNDDFRTLITIDGLGHGAGALTLRPEDLGTNLRRRLLGADVEIGAPDFDGAAFLQGQTPMALAVLDPDTRRRVVGLLGGSIRGQQVRAEMRDGVIQVLVRERGQRVSAKRLARVLEGVLELAQRLAAPRDVAERIADNFSREPEPGVRREMVLALAREFPEHPATRATLREGLRDSDGEVRLRAAVALGGEGRDTLLELIEDSGQDACVAGAIGVIGGELPSAQVLEVLRRAFERNHLETALACITALGRPGDAAAERRLIELLGHGEAKVAVAAARTLGQVGSSAAVGPLREASASLWSGELGSAARQAVAEIQARLTGAAPGQLSLAGGEAGALSLAQGEAGALSMTQDQAVASPLQCDPETDRQPPAPPPSAQTA